MNKRTGLRLAGFLIGVVIMIIGAANISKSLSEVKQADKDVDVTCQVLKLRVIDLRNVVNEIDSDATADQLHNLSDKVQDYNDRCAARSGPL